MQKISLQKKNFFNSIGLDIKNLPNELQIKINSMQDFLPIETLNFFNNDELCYSKMKPFRLKNLVGTVDSKYNDKFWIDAFINSEKTDNIVKLYFKNPNYYFKELRKSEQTNCALELYEDNGKFFIKDGVGRLALMMIKYQLEMSRAESKEERLMINKKYTFVANVKSTPKDRDIIYLLNMLSEIYGKKLEIKKIDNSEECNYKLKYGKKVIEITNKDELENFIKNSYLPKEYQTTQRLKGKISNLAKIGLQYKQTEENEECLLVIGKIFPNYDVFVKYYNKIKEYNLEDEFYNKLDLNNITYEVVLNQLIKNVKQHEIASKDNKKKKVKSQKDKIIVKEEKKIEKSVSDLQNSNKKENSKEKSNSITEKVKIKKDANEDNELEEQKKATEKRISTISENTELMYYKLKKQEAEIRDLANSSNILLNIDKMNDERINANISSIKTSTIKLKKKINETEDISDLKTLNEVLKDLEKLSNKKDILAGYKDEMEKIFIRCFNKAVQKLITDSKLRKLDLQREEIEAEKCSFFSKLVGKAKLKQAKLDNINLKKQLILSESQFGDKLYYYIEDSLSDAYAYLRSEEDNRCLPDLQLFLRNFEANVKIKQFIDQEKLNKQVKEKISGQQNLPQLSLSREKRTLFSKAQINLMQEKNNELKRVIQITRANSLKQQNTGIVPILGNLKSTDSLNKFYSNLNEINTTLQSYCNLKV